MFKLNPNPTFRAKVGVPVPGGAPQEIEFEFKHRTASALNDFINDPKTRALDNEDFVLELAVGWSGIDAEFNRQSLTTLFENYHGAAFAIRDKYLSELTAARLGN